MAMNEAMAYKALYFDLKIKSLEKYYSADNPKQAYGQIRKFLTKNEFTHEQYSGYHSNYKTTDVNILKLIEYMQEELPWLAECTNRFEVADLGENYNLMGVLRPEQIKLS